MNWLRQKDELARHLAPEVARFVLLALRHLEQENVFDAPSIISGVVRQMRVADSDVIRRASGRTERLLKSTLARGYLRSVGA